MIEKGDRIRVEAPHSDRHSESGVVVKVEGKLVYVKFDDFELNGDQWNGGRAWVPVEQLVKEHTS